jgi:hypothetical protein
VISLSQGLYLNTGQRKHRKMRAHIKHPCPGRDSNPQSRPASGRRLFMPQTARLPRGIHHFRTWKMLFGFSYPSLSWIALIASLPRCVTKSLFCISHIVRGSSSHRGIQIVILYLLNKFLFLYRFLYTPSVILKM